MRLQNESSPLNWTWHLASGSRYFKEDRHINLLDEYFWRRNKRALGLIAIAIGLGAWTLEFVGTVYVCPYCRVQRTVIAILGLIMILPLARHWVSRYFSLVIGFFGAVVATNQNFMGWAKISKGEFAFNEQLYIDPFLLSGGALFIIIGQLWLILGREETARHDGG